MTLETAIFVLVALILLALLVRLLREPALTPGRESEAFASPAIRRLPQVDGLVVLHCRHFPQLRQALAQTDTEFMQRRASRELQRRWRRERHRVMQDFLGGLREDYMRLVHLARAVAALSPRVSRKREAELFWLGLRFRGLLFLVMLRLQLGTTPLAGLRRLTGILSGLAEELEAGIIALEESSRASLRAQAGFTP